MNLPDPGQLESLIAQALQVRDEQGAEALEDFVRGQPTHEAELREALGDLHSADLLAPQQATMPAELGEFRLGTRLGAGGMGMVYAAEQSSLGREVAVKVVRPELLLFEGARERFQREIDAVARLEHPAIVPILATGMHDGVPYYAMPRLSGASGDHVVRELGGRIPRELSGEELRALVGADDGVDAFEGNWWQVVVRLVRQVALGIHHAHTRGVLHRDLKPSNVMLCADGRAVVLDFGLAHARGDTRLTRSGSAAGSPAFMAPEQVRGEPADERTDVYGLAATLFSLLALGSPFEGRNIESVHVEILRGLRRDLHRELGMPRELQVVVACAMDVERSRRYQSALAFADDLRAVLDGHSIQAARLPLSVRTRRFARRHPTAVAVCAVFAGFLLLVPLLLFWQQREANREMAAQVERSDRSVGISIDAADSMIASLARRKLRNAESPHELSIKMLQDALWMFEQLAADEAHRERVEYLRICALFELAKAHADLGGVDAAATRCREIVRYVDEVYGVAGPAPDSVALRSANARTMLVQFAVDRGNFEDVPELLEAARAIVEELMQRGHPVRGALHERNRISQLEAILAQRNGDLERAERAYRFAIEQVDQAPPAPHPHTVAERARLNLAMFLKERGNTREAMQWVDEVIARLAGVADEGYPWPVPRMVRCEAMNERFRLLSLRKQFAAAQRVADELLPTLDAVVRDYGELIDPRQLRGLVATNLSLQLFDEDPVRAERIKLAAIADLDWVLERRPGHKAVSGWQEQNLLGICWLYRKAGKWAQLVEQARRLARDSSNGGSIRTAARDLLRAGNALPEQRAELHEESIVAFQKACRHGATLSAGAAIYAPLRDDPRFLELAERHGK